MRDRMVELINPPINAMARGAISGLIERAEA